MHSKFEWSSIVGTTHNQQLETKKSYLQIWALKKVNAKQRKRCETKKNEDNRDKLLKLMVRARNIVHFFTSSRTGIPENWNQVYLEIT